MIINIWLSIADVEHLQKAAKPNLLRLFVCSKTFDSSPVGVVNVEGGRVSLLTVWSWTR